MSDTAAARLSLVVLVSHSNAALTELAAWKLVEARRIRSRASPMTFGWCVHVMQKPLFGFATPSTVEVLNPRNAHSKTPAIQAPAWAMHAENARKLLPTALVGAWHKASSADREVVRLLAREDDDHDVEVGIAALLALEDSPLWSVGEYRGVVSRIDALFGIREFVTGPDLESFFRVAECVLSETDPALELPEDERWAANVYGKVRDHSAALRRGIRETLVLLSVHGDTLFRNRLGVDLEVRISSLIHRLLTPLTIDKLLSHQDDLPDYAEAAPSTFLKLIEADLREPEPVVFRLLEPIESGPFARCLRTGLLWALEGLAWNNLGRVSLILARMSTIAIEARKRARGAYDRLKPRDPVIRHSWLFADTWIDPSVDEEAVEKFDHAKHADWTRSSRPCCMKCSAGRPDARARDRHRDHTRGEIRADKAHSDALRGGAYKGRDCTRNVWRWAGDGRSWSRTDADA